MQQSSSSIANLAAALAKAQVELVNPEKSMIARPPLYRPPGIVALVEHRRCSWKSLRKPAPSLEQKGSESTSETIEKSGPGHPEPRRRSRACEICRRTSLLDLRPASARPSPPPICTKPPLGRHRGTVNSSLT
jgi:hypothetical protein